MDNVLTLDSTPQTSATWPAPAEPRRPRSTGWPQILPVLTAPGVTVRNVSADDATSLMRALSDQDVTQFIGRLPETVEDFEQFIAWATKQQATGTYACFVIAAPGSNDAVGLIQLRDLGNDLALAEWGFAIARQYWGTGLFNAAARLVLDFAFTVAGVERLEGRCVVENARGIGALRRLHAVPERLIRAGLVVGSTPFDQIVWIITAMGHRSRARLGIKPRPGSH